MASGDEDNTMEVSASKEHRFGVHELSDVVFIVGKERFHRHKMFLADRSNYFAAMFKSDFKEKEKKEVPINANPQAFRWLMEILYNGQVSNHCFLLCCNIGCDEYPCDAHWRATSSLLHLAHRFLVFDIVRSSIDLLMVQCNKCQYGGDCIYCATKYLLSLHYNLDEYEAVNTSSTSKIVEALSELKKGGVEFEISSVALEKLLKKE